MGRIISNDEFKRRQKDADEIKKRGQTIAGLKKSIKLYKDVESGALKTIKSLKKDIKGLASILEFCFPLANATRKQEKLYYELKKRWSNTSICGDIKPPSDKAFA